MKRSVILSLMFGLVLAVLVLPELQRRLRIFDLAPLQGAFTLSPRPGFSSQAFVAGTYQQQAERFIEDRIGFRPLLIRIRNQIDFMLYNKANGEGIIIAGKGVIIEEDYILEYLGKLFIGEKTINQKLERVRFVQDTLFRMGINLAIVFEPGKASYHADLIPKRYQPQLAESTTSNYEYFTRRCSELGIRCLDLNQYFKTLKPTTPYPLYPKYGTHWSNYGMVVASDTLVKYVEKLCGKPVNHFRIKETVVSTSLQDTDFDGGASMNLLWKPSSGNMAYPRIEFQNVPERFRPMVLVVADSYYWNIYNAGIPRNIFANEDFWYYHRMVYPDHYNEGKTVDQVDIQQEVEKQDVILVMITERFLYTAFWNFTDDLYRIYKPAYQPDRLYDIGNRIRRDRNWFGQILKEATQRGITTEELIEEHAGYILEAELESSATRTYEEHLLLYKLKMKHNPEWFESIKRKATESNLGVDEMLHRDAVWMYEYEILGMHRQ